MWMVHSTRIDETNRLVKRRLESDQNWLSSDEFWHLFHVPKDFDELSVYQGPTENMFQKKVDGAFKSSTLDEWIVKWWPESDENWLNGIGSIIFKKFSYENPNTRSFDPFAPKLE